MIAALELPRRTRRAEHVIAYLAASIPIAILGVIAVLLLAVGAALSVIRIGLPALRAAAAACRRLVGIDRRLANRFLGTRVPPLAPGGRPAMGTLWRRSLDVLSDRSLWRTVALLAIKPPLTVALLIVGLAPLLLCAWLVHLGMEAMGDFGDVDYFGPWSFGPGLGVALLLLALPAAVLSRAALDALHTLLCTITRALLLPRITPNAPVRELLAESLGDHSVAIAYWLPDREMFVDESGQRVELPDPTSGRAWTAVEQDGRPVAALTSPPASARACSEKPQKPVMSMSPRPVVTTAEPR